MAPPRRGVLSGRVTGLDVEAVFGPPHATAHAATSATAARLVWTKRRRREVRTVRVCPVKNWPSGQKLGRILRANFTVSASLSTELASFLARRLWSGWLAVRRS